MGESFEPRASPSSGNAESFASHKERVFGGGAEDRAAPCRLFSADFERENAEAQEREFDFVFRHGTVVLKVEEDDFGRIVPVVSGLSDSTSFLRLSACVDAHWLRLHRI